MLGHELIASDDSLVAYLYFIIIFDIDGYLNKLSNNQNRDFTAQKFSSENIVSS